MKSLLLGVALLTSLSPSLHSQQRTPTIKDLTSVEGSVPVRIVGYGIVVGLDGTGDRGSGARSGDQTVQSVANVLRRFGIEIPPSALRTRNAAAVLVTAEISPYLRKGARFDITVSSIGDARSLKGGTLWMTPLVTDPNSKSYGTAQGSLILSEGRSKDSYPVETSARIPNGGILEENLPRTQYASSSRLYLTEPDITTASRIAEAINREIGSATAKVDDPGAISLDAGDSADLTALIVRIQGLTVTLDDIKRIVIDGKDGSVAAGGEITIGNATVSHSGITVSIGPQRNAAQSSDGNREATPVVSLTTGVSVQRLATALHAVQMEATEIAAIFTALREVGAISAEIVVR